MSCNCRSFVCGGAPKPSGYLMGALIPARPLSLGQDACGPILMAMPRDAWVLWRSPRTAKMRTCKRPPDSGWEVLRHPQIESLQELASPRLVLGVSHV